MIHTVIILEYADAPPVWYNHEGFAKSEADAMWLFEFCGWKPINDECYPQLCLLDEEGRLSEAELGYQSNPSELQVLGTCLLLN
ncbi:hypothetical protein DYU11_20065 [Fibrisoma montanum]|uniref:Uncharacterized protein n=1 Tax=Fibrisoma montanum TaxID=2305895 RepID=A0A418M3Q8_9BACT|nr:hypothetical protein DYU11_20065 [Fibrisoma montanum]